MMIIIFWEMIIIIVTAVETSNLTNYDDVLCIMSKKKLITVADIYKNEKCFMHFTIA
jgi:hypothetical protein